VFAFAKLFRLKIGLLNDILNNFLQTVLCLMMVWQRDGGKRTFSYAALEHE
jgi:hypothetical protein